MNDIRIACVIFHSPFGKTDDNLNKMTQWAEKAKEADVKLLCFPEMNITGYGIDADVAKTAERIPGKISTALCDLSKRTNIVILAGMAEIDHQDHLFASHLVIKPDGFVGLYRKLHIAPPEKHILTQGNDIPLFHIDDTCFGIQLCYDAHFPELSTYMALKGAEIIFFPHASPRGTPEEKYHSWMRHLPARAYDNSIFVVACNQTGENGKGLAFPGIALAINPSGNVIQKDLSGKEEMIIIDLRKEELQEVRNHRMRYFLPNQRKDLFISPSTVY